MADGSYYEGEFTNGEIQGHGFKFFARSGNTYSGQFLQGELHGQGVMNYSDKRVYEGEWHRNLRQGKTDKLKSIRTERNVRIDNINRPAVKIE